MVQIGLSNCVTQKTIIFDYGELSGASAGSDAKECDNYNDDSQLYAIMTELSRTIEKFCILSIENETLMRENGNECYFYTTTVNIIFRQVIGKVITRSYSREIYS